MPNFVEHIGEAEQVTSPRHYTRGGVEAIVAIAAIVVGYTGKFAVYAGNVCKYIARAPFKGKAREDLKKAQWYMNRLVEEWE